MERIDQKELVHHPSHYNRTDRKECWDEMIDIFGVGAVIIFDCLSAYKYYYRAGEKEGNPKEQDLKKIQEYMEHAEQINGMVGGHNHALITHTDEYIKEMQRILRKME